MATRTIPRHPTSVRMDRPLTDEEIRAIAPSVFATDKHPDRSDRYSYVSTAAVLDQLRDQGYEPFRVAQSRTRIEGRRAYTKHRVDLRPVGQIAAKEHNELSVTTAHDGTLSLLMFASRYRLACGNGLVVGHEFPAIRIPHVGQAADTVAQAAKTVVGYFPEIDESRDRMDAVVLTDSQRLELAQTALERKWPAVEEAPAPITADKLLVVRNYEERPNTLWSTYNIVQSNLLNGGISGRPDRRGRPTKTRAIEGISQNVRLNRDLWDIAQGWLTN